MVVYTLDVSGLNTSMHLSDMQSRAENMGQFRDGEQTIASVHDDFDGGMEMEMDVEPLSGGE